MFSSLLPANDTRPDARVPACQACSWLSPFFHLNIDARRIKHGRQNPQWPGGSFCQRDLDSEAQDIVTLAYLPRKL